MGHFSVEIYATPGSTLSGNQQQYDWGAEKRAALEAWAVDLERIVSGKQPADNLVKLERG